MKWIIFVLTFVVVVVAATSCPSFIAFCSNGTMDDGLSLVNPSKQISCAEETIANAEFQTKEKCVGADAAVKTEDEHRAGAGVVRRSLVSEEIEVPRSQAEDTRIFIGTPRDPDDPVSLILSDPEVIIVGNPRDPDDPASLILSDPEVITIGEPKNPDDPASLILQDVEVITVGIPKDPDSAWSLNQDNSEAIQLGEPRDPDFLFPDPDSR